MKKTALGALALSVLLLTGCNANLGGLNNPTVIKVNGSEIHKNDFEQKYKETISVISSHQKNFNIDDPKNKFFKIIYKDKTINDLILDELMIQEAKKVNAKVTDKDINEEIQNIEKKLGGKNNLEQMLKTNNVSKNVFIDDIKHQLLVTKIVKATKMQKDITDEEVKKYYEQNREQVFKHPDLIKASHILVKDEATAKKILAEVKKNPSDFGKIAQKNSIDKQSAEKLGDLGYFQPTEMVPEFSNAAMKLTPGNISEIVKSQFGYHIILVTDKKKGGFVAFDEVKLNIKEYLKTNQKMEIFQNVMEKARSKAKIEYIDNSFDPAVIRKEILQISPKSDANGVPSNVKAPIKAPSEK